MFNSATGKASITFDLDKYKQEIGTKTITQYYKDRRATIDSKFEKEYDQLIFDEDFSSISNPAGKSIYTLNSKNPFKLCPDAKFDWNYTLEKEKEFAEKEL